MTPMDHMSASKPTGSNANTSGATNSGVPCIAWTSIPKSHRCDKPKSISLIAGAEPGATFPGKHFHWARHCATRMS